MARLKNGLIVYLNPYSLNILHDIWWIYNHVNQKEILRLEKYFYEDSYAPIGTD